MSMDIYTDEELLMELRRRGRIEQFEVSDVTPGQHTDKHTIGMQFDGLMMRLGHAMIEKIGHHSRCPGATVENVRDALFSTASLPKGRRMTIPVSVVITKAKS